jgi:hypothetical protein
MRYLACGLIIFIASCSGLTPRREIVNNTFFSSNPKVAVSISDDFTFDDKKRSDSFSFFSSGGESGTNVSHENYRFIDMANQKVVIIRISKLSRGYWNRDLKHPVSNPLEKGVVKNKNGSFQYAVFATQEVDGGCFLNKYIARLSGANSQTLIAVRYIQQIPRRFENCSRWTSPAELTEKQQNFLSRFNADYEQDVHFIDYKPPGAERS